MVIRVEWLWHLKMFSVILFPPEGSKRGSLAHTASRAIVRFNWQCVSWTATAPLTTSRNKECCASDRTITALSAFIFTQARSSATLMRITQRMGSSVPPTNLETHNRRIPLEFQQQLIVLILFIKFIFVDM